MNEIKKIPNLISFTRVILTILIDIAIYKKEIYIAIFFITIASISDYLDGYIARRFESTSKYGAQLDIIADKIFSINMLLLILLKTKTIIPASIIFILLSRELSMIIIRNIYKKKISASKLGKIKTVFLNLAYCLFFIHYPSYITMLYLGAFFSTISQIEYIKQIKN